ncbi:MAG TPA: hypothetical protein VKU87_00125, partial [Thermomicrobiaceae bacterium]|nr:hypothetical protein [Thermomicrobiaceae bacterium]
MENRRMFLKKLVALGALAPFSGVLSPIRAAARGGALFNGIGGQSTAAHWSAGLTTQQMAGQRVIFSYPGLTVPQSLINQIKAG